MMTKRATKSERREAAKFTEQPTIYFEQLLTMYLENLKQIVTSLRNRPNESQNFGPEGMFIVASEALSIARRQPPEGQVSAYVSAAAYCMVGAMLAGSSWFLPMMPLSEAQTEEQIAPEGGQV